VINSLRGTITEKSAHSVCLEIQGVEWQLEASAATISGAPSVGSEGKLYTWLYHKEDMMALYGFSSKNERSLFLDLISVSGVGPKGALKILSAARADQIVQYLEEENLDGLSSLPGLGKKTAQKILLQLKGKLTWDSGTDSGSGSTGPGAEWIESLSAMGFDKRKVQTVVRGLMDDEEIQAFPDERKEQEILRRAIVELST
jgi:holliday junction DNA helicase RuvA